MHFPHRIIANTWRDMKKLLYTQKEKKKFHVTIFETIPSSSYALINSGWFPGELEPWWKNVYTTELKNRTSALNMTNLLIPLTSLPQGTRASFKPYFIRDQHRVSLQRPLDIKNCVKNVFRYFSPSSPGGPWRLRTPTDNLPLGTDLQPRVPGQAWWRCI